MRKLLTLGFLSVGAAFCAISVSPTSYALTYKQGAAVPAPLAVTVQSSGTLFVVSIAADSTGWLDATPKQGVGPTTVSLSVDPRNLAIGTYSAIVTFNEPVPQPNSVTLRVDLTVTSATAPPTPINPSSLGYIAHIADGASWTTALTVVNLLDTPQRLTVKFWSDSGHELVLPISGVGSYSGVYFDLAGNGSGNLETAGTATSVSTGWISIEGQANGFGGLAVFRSSAAGRPDAEAASPMRANPPPKVVIPFDNRNGGATGVALANFDNKANAPTLTFRDGDGKTVLSAAVMLGPGEHTSFSLMDKYPNLAAAVGTVEIDSTNVVSLGLRFNTSKGTFTSIQVMEKPQ